MFNNLIESSSHSRELRRRGSFVLFTTASYALLFAIIGVVSIHAYDAQMEDQNLDISILRFAPVLAEPTTEPERGPSRSSPNNPSTALRPTRPVLVDSTHNPLNTPPDVGVASPIPPAPRGAVIGPSVLDPPGSGHSSSDRGSGSNNNGETFARELPSPPPAATPAPAPRVIRSSTVLNSKALSLPKPPYPAMAKLMKVQGMVSVQVFIDEFGKVMSAKAVSGHPALVREAEKAALQALFSPTKIGDQPVKVSGTITYNFVLQP